MSITKRRDPTRAARKVLLRSLRVTQRLVRRAGKKAGTPPGTLVHTGPRRVEEARLQLIRYGPDSFEEREIASPAECFPPTDEGLVTWLNVDGLHDTDVLTEVGRLAQLHPLLLEDVLSIGQRPKQEEYEDQHYIVMRMLRFDRENGVIEEEQISVVVGPHFVLSFQEAPGDVWEPVRERLRNGRGRIRGSGPDYLAYALMDAIVDEYFSVIEAVGDRLEVLEAEVMDRPRQSTIAGIYNIKGELLIARKAVWPLRDLFNTLIRDGSELFTPETKIFLRDAYDHAVQVIDTVETLRDLTAGLIDLYLSSVSNRMNEIMKVLTLIATLFIPLTFVAGLYGMNFTNMPELQWRWGYPAVLGIMLAVTVAMLIYFKRKSWF